MKNLLKNKILIIAIFVTVCILYLSLIKMPEYNVAIRHLDKLQHCFAYLVLTFFWLFAFYKKERKHLIIFCCILFGILIEVLQYTITNYRTGDYLDVLANSSGVLFGFFIFNQAFKRKQVKKQKDL
ncbi:MAG: VanZ family protein [Polaribacter sp.]|jgi:VanZ family protein|tara:strand:- start:270 stop:647 length:378 start_codon:yes stop_codon:yes gene_type:complete